MPRYAVLVVESEPFVLMNSLRNIAEAGFTAYGACDADAAIAVLERHEDLCDFFADMKTQWMMDALKLAYAVRDRWPPVTIVVTSGDASVSAGDLPNGGVFVDVAHATPWSRTSPKESLLRPPSIF